MRSIDVRTIQPRSAGHHRRNTPTRLGRLWVLLAAVALALAACGTPVPPQPADALECQVEGYACSWSDVDVVVIERSLALGQAVADLIADGGSIDDALAVVAAEPDIASFGAGATGIVFRLLGGRPVVVDTTIDESILADTDGDAWTAPVADADLVQPTMVAGAGRAKRALVLAPFAYDFKEHDSSGAVAGMLASHPQYDGGVTYVATSDAAEPRVGIDHLLDLESYDVVYMTTHGGSLCVDVKEKDLVRTQARGLSGRVSTQGQDGQPLDCRTDFLIQRFTGTAQDLQDEFGQVGVVLYVGSKHRSIAVTSDFFRQYYPGGLHDTLFVLVSCSTFAPDFTAAIAGSEGVYVSWDAGVYGDTAWYSATLIEELLATGATVGRVVASLGDLPVDPTTGGRLRSSGRAAGGDLRIVDLVTAADAISGDDLRHAVEIQVDGQPGDGYADYIDLAVTVIGAFSEDAGNFTLGVSINGDTRLYAPLDEVTQPTGDATWTGEIGVSLGRDAVPGESLDIVVFVNLPEGGKSSVAGSPDVAEEQDELGPTWAGTLTWSQHSLYGGLDYDIVADVVFELDDGESLNDPYVRYHLVGGSYTFSVSGEDAFSCFVTAEVSGALTEQEGTYLTIDQSGGGMPTVSGFGGTGTPPVVANVACVHIDSYTMEIGTNKTFLYIPSSMHHVVNDSSIVGAYSETGASATEWTWSLQRAD